MKTFQILFIVLFTFCLSCSQEPPKSIVLSNNFNIQKKSYINNKDLINWYEKDIEIDTIPGISLERAYTKIIKHKVGKNVVVAVIDTEIDINHEDFKNSFWVNSDEIIDNNLDDDGNGYIDDINGWNFLGNINGENILYTLYESTRIIKKHKVLFENKEINEIPKSELFYFNQYQKAKKINKSELKLSTNVVKNGPAIINSYVNALDKVLPFLSEDKMSIARLDSLKKENDSLTSDINYIIDIKNVTGIDSLTDLKDDLAKYQRKIDIYLNTDYQERKLLNDNSNDLLDKQYGNNKISHNIEKLFHGTIVSGVMAADRNNKIGAKGFGGFIKIMPVCISANGDEHDKDMALAIRYAVDNGANVINISSGKYFSLHPEWVLDAIKYAASKEVLVVTSAGNRGIDLDIPSNYNYPNDTDSLGKELVDNFIKVGTSTHKLNDSLKITDTNYGKREVDIFAPGEHIYTLLPNNKYDFRGGSSIAAPMVSGVAGLIWSYYPNLTAPQVKQIIMESGIEYNIPVKVPMKGTKKDTLIPFNQLSKSGKIVNAYNALIMADSIARNN